MAAIERIDHLGFVVRGPHASRRAFVGLHGAVFPGDKVNEEGQYRLPRFRLDASSIFMHLTPRPSASTPASSTCAANPSGTSAARWLTSAFSSPSSIRALTLSTKLQILAADPRLIVQHSTPMGGRCRPGE